MRRRRVSLAGDGRRRRWVLDWPHETGWATVPCRCGVCRADRFVNRVSGILVGMCVGYFLAHIVIAAIR